MKTYWFWSGLILLSSCSAPRYTYYFDHQRSLQRRESVTASPQVIRAPNQDGLTTSIGKVLEGRSIKKQLQGSRSSQPDIREQRVDPAAVIHDHRDNFLQPISTSAKGMEPDLKRSIIFGVAGIVAMIIGGQVFWVLGSLSLLIGLIFGVKWLLRQ